MRSDASIRPEQAYTACLPRVRTLVLGQAPNLPFAAIQSHCYHRRVKPRADLYACCWWWWMVCRELRPCPPQPDKHCASSGGHCANLAFVHKRPPPSPPLSFPERSSLPAWACMYGWGSACTRAWQQAAVFHGHKFVVTSSMARPFCETRAG